MDMLEKIVNKYISILKITGYVDYTSTVGILMYMFLIEIGTTYSDLNNDDKRMLCNIIDELEYSNSVIRQCIVYPYNYGTISDKIYNGDFIFGSATTTDNIRDIVKSMFDEYNLFAVS